MEIARLVRKRSSNLLLARRFPVDNLFSMSRARGGGHEWSVSNQNAGRNITPWPVIGPIASRTMLCALSASSYVSRGKQQEAPPFVFVYKHFSINTRRQININSAKLTHHVDECLKKGLKL